MARSSHVFFGSFGETSSVGVHSEDWWLAPATDVILSGKTPLWLDLADSIQEDVDVAWMRRAMPVGLQMKPPTALAKRVGFIATRVEERDSSEIDVVYPFLFAEHEGSGCLGFSELGPPVSIAHTIARAFGKCLIAGAV